MSLWPVQCNPSWQRLQKRAGLFGLVEYLISQNIPIFIQPLWKTNPIELPIFIIIVVPILKIVPCIQYFIINQLRIINKEPTHFLLEILNLANIYILLWLDWWLIANIAALWILRLEIYFLSLWDERGLLLLVFTCRMGLLLLIMCVHLLWCGAVNALCWFLEHGWIILWYHYLKGILKIFCLIYTLIFSKNSFSIFLV